MADGDYYLEEEEGCYVRKYHRGMKAGSTVTGQSDEYGPSGNIYCFSAGQKNVMVVSLIDGRNVICS